MNKHSMDYNKVWLSRETFVEETKNVILQSAFLYIFICKVLLYKSGCIRPPKIQPGKI